MLTDLHIRNFAIAEDLNLEFGEGMTVLTGETGAGKSILIGALGLVLGDRADSASVRSGADKTEICATFDIRALDAVGRWLADHDLAADDDCHLRRIVNANGRSKAYINGASVAVQSLRELGGALMDIHGQHEHQALLQGNAQRALLDGFGRHDAALRTVQSAFDDWYRLDQNFQALRDANTDRVERLDLLRFQVHELSGLNLEPGEYESLAEKQRRVSHLATLAEGVATASDALEGGDQSAQQQLGRARRALGPLLDYDASLQDALTMLEDAQIQLDEAGDTLRRYGADLDVDPAERDALEQRLDILTDIARKHRVGVVELPAKLAELSERLDGLENADARLDELAAQLDTAAAIYRKAAAALRKKRVSAAAKLSREIDKIIRQLGMPDATFTVDVDKRDTAGFGRDGLDVVVMRVAANPGEPARPIAKVASGGELSRISLAIQVVTARLTPTRCMVFDEVDAGIGGAVAQIVGAQLKDLAASAQVLCVTHLPQVASQANHHLKVAKTAHGGKTRSTVSPLSRDEQIEELARMLGGVEITKRTRAHAAEMLTKAGGGG